MKHPLQSRLAIVAAIALAGSLLGAPASADDDDDDDERTPMEIAGIDLVVKMDGDPVYGAADLARDFPVTLTSTLLRSRDIYVFTPSDPATEHDEDKAERLAARIKRSSHVRYAEPDYATELADNRYHSWPSGDPEDAGDEPGPFRDQPLSQRLQLDQVHVMSTGAGTTVAVLDTGAQLDHPALAGRLVPGYDYLDDDADPTDVEEGLDVNGNGVVDEAFGHGTFVAGMVALVAPDARIMPLRVLDSDGSGSVFLVSQAIIDATDAGADVVNISLGTSQKLKSKLIKDVIDYADDHGVQVVAAAGNGNTDSYQYPAQNKGVTSVTSSEVAQDEVAAFANWGSWVDLAAPADHVLGPVPGGGYAWWAGTSMAAPQVSGQIALIKASGATGDKDLKAIGKTARKFAKKARKNVKHGSIDVLGSLQYLEARRR